MQQVLYVRRKVIEHFCSFAGFRALAQQSGGGRTDFFFGGGMLGNEPLGYGHGHAVFLRGLKVYHREPAVLGGTVKLDRLRGIF